MRILSSEEIRQVEQKAFQNGKTELQLMRRAGAEVTNVIVSHYNLEKTPKKVSVVCGNGKNGGDGFVIAKLLKQIGCGVRIIIVDAMPKISECVTVFDEAVEFGVPYEKFSDETSFDDDIIVDCMFGIGFHGDAKGVFKSAIDKVNASKAEVVAVDVPSGTDSFVGAVSKSCIKADLTVAISTLKYAHVLPPSNEFCSKTVTVDIGIEDFCYDVVKSDYKTIEPDYVKSCFKPRGFNSNKGSYGKLLCLCGSYTMPGAGIISTSSALRSGAGLVTCAFPRAAYSAMTSHLVSSLFMPLGSENQEKFSPSCAEQISASLPSYSAVLLGCGIGQGEEVADFVSQIMKNTDAPIILDADGINAAASRIDMLRERKVITPHPGEMARLVGKTVSEVQASRIDTAVSFAKQHGVIVVLKGANTIVTDGEKVFVNTTGNPGMAKGGTGDMLAGMIASFAAQGMSLLDAAVSAVYIHGMCGDKCAEELSMAGMTVQDMIEVLPKLLSDFE